MDFSFRKSTSTSMKCHGTLDLESGSILCDDGDRDLKTILFPFNGAEIDLSATLKTVQELDEPEQMEDEHE